MNSCDALFWDGALMHTMFCNVEVLASSLEDLEFNTLWHAFFQHKSLAGWKSTNKANLSENVGLKSLGCSYQNGTHWGLMITDEKGHGAALCTAYVIVAILARALYVFKKTLAIYSLI